MSEIRSALSILPEIRKGFAVGELSQAIHNATAAVKEHGKPAVIRLEITIQPFKGKQSMSLIQPPVVITAETTSKLPKADAEATLFFLDDNDNLSTSMRREEQLGLQVAPDLPGTIKEVSNDR